MSISKIGVEQEAERNTQLMNIKDLIIEDKGNISSKKRTVGFAFESDRQASPKRNIIKYCQSDKLRKHINSSDKGFVLQIKEESNKNEYSCKESHFFYEPVNINNINCFGYYTKLPSSNSNNSGLFYNSKLKCKFSVLALFEPILNEAVIRQDSIWKDEFSPESKKSFQQDMNNISSINSSQDKSHELKLDLSVLRQTNSINLFTSIVKQNLYECYVQSLNENFKAVDCNSPDLEEVIEKTVSDCVCNSDLFKSKAINKEDPLSFTLLTITISNTINIATIGHRVIFIATEYGKFVCFENTFHQASVIHLNNFILENDSTATPSLNDLDILTLSIPQKLDFILVLNSNIVRHQTYNELIGFIYQMIAEFNIKLTESSAPANPSEFTNYILTEINKKYFEKVSQYTNNLVNLIFLSDRAIKLSIKQIKQLQTTLISKQIKKQTYGSSYIKRHATVNLSTLCLKSLLENSKKVSVLPGLKTFSKYYCCNCVKRKQKVTSSSSILNSEESKMAETSKRP